MEPRSPTTFQLLARRTNIKVKIIDGLGIEKMYLDVDRAQTEHEGPMRGWNAASRRPGWWRRRQARWSALVWSFADRETCHFELHEGTLACPRNLGLTFRARRPGSYGIHRGSSWHPMLNGLSMTEPRFVHDDIVRLVHEDQIGTVKEVRQTDTGYHTSYSSVRTLPNTSKCQKLNWSC